MRRLSGNGNVRCPGTVGALFVLVAVWLFAAPHALAQDYQVRELIDRLNRLERDLGEVQRQFYRGGGTLPPPDGGAPSTVGNLAPTQAAELSVRIDQLETELRALTGSVERTDHGISVVRQRLDKLVADVDFRLTSIERMLQQVNQGGTGTPPVTAGAAPDTAQPAVAAASPAPPPPSQPGTLGTLPADQAGNVVAAVPKSVLPPGDTKTRYNFAFRLLAQGDYEESQVAFQEFLAAHGDDGLAGNAQYWLGESFYVREIYDQAARAFLAGYENYKQNPKAPDNLFKLGMSLTHLGQTEEACAAFDQLAAEFPSLSSAIRQRMPTERERAKCK